MDISGIKTSEIMSSGVVSVSVGRFCAGVAPAINHPVVVSKWGLGEGTHEYQPWPKCIATHINENFTRAFKVRARRLTFLKIRGMGIRKD